jgi:hypothetical protein
VLLLGATASAQIDRQQYEEAQRRLAERQRQRQEAGEVVAPTPAPRPKETPAPAPERNRRLALKNGAPDTVKEWFAKLDLYRELAHQLRIKEADDEVERLQKALAQAEFDLQRIYDRKIPTSTVRGGGYVQTKQDAGAINRQRIDAKAKKEQIAKLKQDIRNAETERKRITDSTPDPTFIHIPRLSLSVGSYGRIDEAIRVRQVVGPSDFIGVYLDKDVWFSQFDTSRLVDDQKVVYDKPVIITKTKQYATAAGSTRTVLYAEPLDLLEWIEVVEE